MGVVGRGRESSGRGYIEGGKARKNPNCPINLPSRILIHTKIQHMLSHMLCHAAIHL